MPESRPLTVLCLASYLKGHEFLREAKRQGCRVLLLTSLCLKDADWPRESIDEMFYMPDDNHKWDIEDTIHSVSYLARSQKLDRIVPLDDFDLETAAALREHLRIPGMGETTTRYFRDKLAMRSRAKSAGLPVPEFVHVLNDEDIADFARRVPAPWVLKPRSLAGAIGIRKIGSEQGLWRAVEKLGDERSYYLVEQYVPGDIFHVDTIVFHRKLLFSSVSRYGAPPMDVTHGGGVFSTRTLPPGSQESKHLAALNWRVLEAFGLVWGVSHSEFIRAHDGTLHFLETSARVGCANIAELVEAATGINLWAEWAKIEVAGESGSYKAPKSRKDFAGLLVSLTKDEWPDSSSFSDPEIVWRMKKPWHMGLIVKSESAERIQELLNAYTERVRREFMASQPPPDKPTH